MMAFSTRSWISSTAGLRPISWQLSSTLWAMRLIWVGVMRNCSSTAALARVMAETIFSKSKTTSVPLRLMIFMVFLLSGHCET